MTDPDKAAVNERGGSAVTLLRSKTFVAPHLDRDAQTVVTLQSGFIGRDQTLLYPAVCPWRVTRPWMDRFSLEMESSLLKRGFIN
ncbi:uncharacterized [Lates japonicus]